MLAMRVEKDSKPYSKCSWPWIQSPGTVGYDREGWVLRVRGLGHKI